MIDKLKSICRVTLAHVTGQRAAIAPSEASRHLPEPIRAALDRSIPEPLRVATANLISSAYSAGTSVERARISSIMDLPSARGFAPLAWALAKGGSDPAQAEQALVAAAVDAVAVGTAADAEGQISTLLH
jgi:hypothetical protein